MEVTIDISMGDVLYAIKNKTNIYGETKRRGGLDYASVSQMQFADDENEGDIIRRAIVTSVASCLSALSEYIYVDLDYIDNIEEAINNDRNIEFMLMLPNNINLTAIGGMRIQLQDYIINRTIGEWYKLTNPGESERYMADSERNMVQAMTLLYKRRRPQRDN